MAEKQQGGESEASPAASLLTSCVRVLLGRPLANREGKTHEIGVIEGVPPLGLDGLSSTASASPGGAAASFRPGQPIKGG